LPLFNDRDTWLQPEIALARTIWPFAGALLSKQEFEKLVAEFSPQVLNVAVRILGDTSSAQDVHQEVFLAIWRRWHIFDGQTNWAGYLYRTTVRKAIELAKRGRAGPKTGHSLSEMPAQGDPLEPLRLAELQRRLAESLGRLPERQAAVFVLSRLEGLRHDKIADLLSCSPTTVRGHLHRAMRRLAKELGDYLE
jgi:RNA polymerase sigma-70 factor (ECF subfamily)